MESNLDQSRSHPRKNPNSDSVEISNTNPIEISFLALISCIGEHPIDPVEISSDSQRIKAINPSIASQRKINFYCRRRRALETSTTPRSKADDEAEGASASRNQTRALEKASSHLVSVKTRREKKRSLGLRPLYY
ncbi:hypothetical protein F2Q69_00057045 [Brassica cretica]|uniref:Uncharacterized protein n=1 Tax=Brassica cretica TaxID=69181 RepID=A0A8S9N9P5_BRACR|nr:hypothetical protein F2Q69_00057045 [Brassica cretica]